MLKTNDLQDIFYTTMADDIILTISKFYLFIPNLLPSVVTQLTLNEAAKNNYHISFVEFYTERRVILDIIVQADIVSTQQVSSPKYLKCAQQTPDRINVPNKNKNNAIFDKVDLRKYNVELDGQRYPRETLLMNYEEKDYFEQNKDLKKIFRRIYRKTDFKHFRIIPGHENKISDRNIIFRLST